MSRWNPSPWGSRLYVGNPTDHTISSIARCSRSPTFSLTFLFAKYFLSDRLRVNHEPGDTGDEHSVPAYQELDPQKLSDPN